MSAEDSRAVKAMRAGMGLVPEEWKGSLPLKAVWLAGFMRGYRFHQEEDATQEGENRDWRPGDPCGSCPSANTEWNRVDGAHCRACGRSDGDE